MKTYPISEELVNEILQYLSGRPYIEVAKIIQKIGKTVEPPKVIPFQKSVEGEE